MQYKTKSKAVRVLRSKCDRYMERKVIYLPGEVLFQAQGGNLASDDKLRAKKSAEAIVLRKQEGLNGKEFWNLKDSN